MAGASLVLLLAVVLGGTGFARQRPVTPASYPVADAPKSYRPAVQRGDEIIAAMQKALMREVTDEMRRGGPASAIRMCHLQAIGVTQEVARREGVSAGRTSDRLRNPTNAPKPWAAPIVAKHAGKPIAGVDGFVVDLGDHVGLLRPIGFRAMCAGCHGPRDRLGPSILNELRERYPADQAVGYTEGQIRGWFWVEVPKG